MMTSTWKHWGLVVAVAVAGMLPAFSAPQDPAPAAAAAAPSPQRVKVPSAAMKRDIPVSVALPKGYSASTAAYPVLYLLHGAGDDEMGWYTRTPVQEMADTYGVIIVSPSVGLSWYFDSPEDKNLQFETFTAVELVKFIDATYRTTPRREARALAGNSMGGHGTMFLAIRHRDTFSAAAPMSGGMDICGSDPQVGRFSNNWGLGHCLGDIRKFPERWNELAVVHQAESLKPGDLEISIMCGSSDFFLQANRQLHEKLTARGIAHDYTESPGTHNWEYWKKVLPLQMAFLDQHFKKATAPAPTEGAAFVRDLRNGRKLTVVTMGTSLTGGTWRWPDVMKKEWLDQEFPGQVTLFNEGVGASASSVGPGNNPALSGLGKLPAVLAHQPDVVFIEFAVNDAYLPYKISPEESRKNLNTLIDRILAANPKTEIILQTMNSVMDKPGSGAHASDRPRLAEYVQGYRDVAKARGLPLVDHYPNWEKLMKEDPARFDRLVPDRIHPQQAGYREILLPELKKTLAPAGK